ncbi:MAG: 50S ribosomal protein L29 [Bacteroidetes bacterium]|nr:50S ribosomal protein L29 [Bacteroidota bacterium]
MKVIEIKDLSIEELKRRLSDEQESLANLRFQLSTSQLESPIRVRTVRRDIARIQTLLRQKERAAAASGQATKTEKTEVKTS